VSTEPPVSQQPVDGDLLDSRAAGAAAARGGAMRAAGYAVGTLLAVASAPLMIRHLGVDDFGRYVTVQSLVAIVAGLSEAGIAAIALREYATRSGADRDRVMRDLLGIRIALTAVGVLAGVAFTLVAGYDAVLVIGTVAVGAAMLLTSLQTLLGASLQGELRFGWVTVTELLRQALFVAVVVVLVIADSGLQPFFWALLPASLVTLALTAMLVRRLIPLRPAFHPARWWPLLRDTATYAAAVALNAAYFRLAVVALSVLASERQTGYFATAFRVVEVLVAVPALVIGAAFPILTRAARDDEERLDSAAGRLVEIGLIMGTWFALGVALAADPIISLLAGSGSQPSVALLRILAFALIPTFVTVAGGYTLLALRRHREILLANAAALGMSLLAAGLLIAPYRATGAAISVLVAELTLAAVTFGALVRIRPAITGVLRRAPAIVAAAVAAGALALAPRLPAAAETAIALLAFPALLVVVGRFPGEIGDALRGRGRERS
jgi:O-antigen/teichoic acid export membrane protein